MIQDDGSSEPEPNFNFTQAVDSYYLFRLNTGVKQIVRQLALNMTNDMESKETINDNTNQTRIRYDDAGQTPTINQFLVIYGF